MQNDKVKFKNGRGGSSGMEDFDPIGAWGTYILTQSREAATLRYDSMLRIVSTQGPAKSIRRDLYD
jgi:hypothetical protein